MTSTTVVTKQITTTSGGTTTVTTGNRDWNSGLCGCFSDCKTLLYVGFCWPCAAGAMSQRVGENCCVPCFVPGGMMGLRAKIRLMLGIQGSLCNDCIITECCTLCATCQMIRELDAAGWPQ